MIVAMVLSAWYCVTPALSNKTDTWQKVDQEVLLEMQKVGCRSRNAMTPCLGLFIKEAEGKYKVMCVPERHRKEYDTESE